MPNKKVFLVTDEAIALKSLLGKIIAEEVTVELACGDVFTQLARFQELQQQLRQREGEIAELRRRLGEVEGMPDFLLNANAYKQELDRELSRSERYQQPLSCLFTAIDQFEPIEQRFGQQGALGMFIEMAEMTRRILRKSDVIARLENDGMGIILPQTDGPGAVAVAEKIRSQVESYLFSAIEDFPVTISAGVVTFPRYGVLAGEDIIRLGTYTRTLAVRDGGNRVAVA